MKNILMFLLALPSLLSAQVLADGDSKNLIFPIGHSVNDSIRFADQLDLKSEYLVSQFTLQGKMPLTYRLILVNDTIAHLEKFSTEWQFQEDFPIDAGYIEVYNDTLFTRYNITDFDHDGDEDLVCWLSSNMNGNMWSSVYLNDQRQQKLVQLYDHASGTYIWDSPVCDKNGIITCTLYGSTFSCSAESTYQLAGLTAVPLKKHFEERSSVPSILDYYYTGENGQWMQISQQASVALFGNEVLFYRLDKNVANDSLYLSKYAEADVQLQPALQEKVLFYDWLTYGSYDADDFYTTFEVVDFNKDGKEDLILNLFTDVHGTRSVIIFLHDAKGKKLIKLYNTAEATEVWSSPEYNAKTKIITSYQIGGNASQSYTSTYKLKGFSALPLKKEVQDRTNVNGITGKGYSESTYTGKKGKWVLKSTVTDE